MNIPYGALAAERLALPPPRPNQSAVLRRGDFSPQGRALPLPATPTAAAARSPQLQKSSRTLRPSAQHFVGRDSVPTQYGAVHPCPYGRERRQGGGPSYALSVGGGGQPRLYYIREVGSLPFFGPLLKPKKGEEVKFIVIVCFREKRPSTQYVVEVVPCLIKFFLTLASLCRKYF